MVWGAKMKMEAQTALSELVVPWLKQMGICQRQVRSHTRTKAIALDARREKKPFSKEQLVSLGYAITDS